MSEFRAFCPNCGNEVNFEALDAAGHCQSCGRKFAFSEGVAQPKDAQGASTKAILRTCLIAALILVAVILVLLAFVYAACSNFIR